MPFNVPDVLGNGRPWMRRVRKPGSFGREQMFMNSPLRQLARSDLSSVPQLRPT
jgi:hypothetical protein